jgi:hypothetical protein
VNIGGKAFLVEEREIQSDLYKQFAYRSQALIVDLRTDLDIESWRYSNGVEDEH